MFYNGTAVAPAAPTDANLRIAKGIATDEGRLLFTDVGNGKIKYIDIDGEIRTYAGGGATLPYATDGAANGDDWIDDTTLTGGLNRTDALLDGADAVALSGLAMDDDGDLFFTMRCRAATQNLAANENANYHSLRIYRIDAATGKIWRVASLPTSQTGTTFDMVYRPIALDRDSNRLYVFEMEGDYSASWIRQIDTIKADANGSGVLGAYADRQQVSAGSVVNAMDFDQYGYLYYREIASGGNGGVDYTPPYVDDKVMVFRTPIDRTTGKLATGLSRIHLAGTNTAEPNGGVGATADVPDVAVADATDQRLVGYGEFGLHVDPWSLDGATEATRVYLGNGISGVGGFGTNSWAQITKLVSP